MTNINSVVVLGAGAMGAAYASRFYEMDPGIISFAASGNRFQRLKTEGLVVNNQHYKIPVTSPEDASPPADLIIVALKHHHMEEALPDLAPFVGDQTIILSVMNGLDSEETIGAVYGLDKLLLAIAVGILLEIGETVSIRIRTLLPDQAGDIVRDRPVPVVSITGRVAGVLGVLTVEGFSGVRAGDFRAAVAIAFDLTGIDNAITAVTITGTAAI